MTISIININDVLSEWASSTPPLCDFTTENVMSAAKIDPSNYKAVFNYLSRLEGFMLIPSKIVLCPNNHKGKSYGLDEEIDLEEVQECYCTDEEFSPVDFLIVFNFVDEFIDQAQKKKKLSTMRSLALT